MSLNPLKQKLVYIYSNGCTSNMIDSERMSVFFKMNDFSMTTTPSKADLLVVNTCAFEKETENDSIEKIKYLQKIKAGNAKVIVTGCLPSINKKRLELVFNGDIFGIRNEKTLDKLNFLIDAKIPISEIKDPNELLHRWPDSKLLAKYKAFKENKIGEEIGHYDENDFHIRIAKGCKGSCSYCAIKFARGKLQSRTVHEILDEFLYGLKKGYRSFKIWADDVGDYGLDIQTDLAELLSEILKINGNYELEILAMNPKQFIRMFDRLLPSLKDKRVKYLNISIQSASSKILKSMQREIDTEDLKLKLIQLRAEASHLIIRTHYMVGFPGETWLDFLRTLTFSFKVKNFKYLTFVFDPKPGTEAAKMKKHISPVVKKLRFYILKTWAKLGSKLYDDGETY